MYFGNFALVFGLAAMLLILSLFTEYEGELRHPTISAILFPLIGSLLWVVLSMATYSIETDTAVYVDWYVGPLYGGIAVFLMALTLFNSFFYISNLIERRTKGKPPALEAEEV